MELIGRVEPGAETESEAGARAENTEMKNLQITNENIGVCH